MYKKLLPYTICIALKSQAVNYLEVDKVRLCNTLSEIEICTKTADETTKPSLNKISKLDSILTTILGHASIIGLGYDIYDETENNIKDMSSARSDEINHSILNLNALFAQIERYHEFDLSYYCSNENPLLQKKMKNSIKRSLKYSFSKRSKNERVDPYKNSFLSIILETVKKQYQSRKAGNTFHNSSKQNAVINLPKDSNMLDQLDVLLRELEVGRAH